MSVLFFCESFVSAYKKFELGSGNVPCHALLYTSGRFFE